MTIKLKKVELSNIRSHEHKIFEPAEEGITAIVGPTGSGKSTIVDSIAWVLYGTKPQGVSKAKSIMRAGAEFGVDKFYAKVELEVDEQELVIERRIVSKGGGVECDVWERLPESGDLNQLAGSAVSHSEPYIRKRLKMDEKGFLSAVLVQQKQVDQLILSKPNERGLVIEKLTGISSITNALKESREELNSLKKAASFTKVDEKKIKEFKKNKKKEKEALLKEENTLDEITKKTKILISDGKELKDQVDFEKTTIEKTTTLNNEKTILDTKLIEKEKNLEEHILEKDRYKKELSLISDSINIDETKKNILNIKNNLRSNDLLLDNCLKEYSDKKSKLEEFESVIKKAEFKDIKINKEKLSVFELDEKDISSKIKKSENEKVSFETEILKIENAIKIISGHNGSCPTCLQKVKDIDTVVSTLNKELKDLNNKIFSSSHKKEELVKNKNKILNLIKDYKEIIYSLESQLTLKDEIELLKNKKTEFKSNKTSLEIELTAIEKVYSKVENQQNVKRNYDTSLSKAQEVNKEIADIKVRLQGISKELNSIGGVTQKVYDKNRDKLDKLKDSYSSYKNKITDLNGKIALIKERLSNLEEKIVNGEAEVKKYKNLLKSVEIASNSTNVIEEFRTDRINNSIPIIEAYASDLLNRFTEGHFTRLMLDSKFNATVSLEDGTERAIGLLSGGELSAASMSLRLAISMLLNSGSSKNLIILDEVLVSQDSNRAELILTTVKDVCKGQVVLIAHNDSIDSITDKTIEL